MNMRMCVILKKLYMTVYGGTPAIIGTQYGDITVRKALMPGYVAQIGSGEVSDKTAYGETPSIAFQKLAGIVKAAQSVKVRAKVLQFAKAA